MSKLGTEPALEREFREGLLGAGDSVRSRIVAAYKDGRCDEQEWAAILAAHSKLDAIKARLIAAGYSSDDLLALSDQNGPS